VGPSVETVRHDAPRPELRQALRERGIGVAHVYHDRHPHGLGGTPGEPQGLQPVAAHVAAGQADLDPLDQVPVALHDADDPVGVGVAEVVQFVVQRTHHPDGGDVQKGQYPRLRHGDDVPPQSVEGVRAGRARIAGGRHPAGQAGGNRQHLVVGRPPDTRARGRR
jgi:hypothetical protein